MSSDKNIVIEISSQIGANVVQYYKVKSLPVSIGRGFDNDVILNDPFICGNHLNITHDKDTENWIVKELDTENGFLVNNKNYGAKSLQQSVIIESGDSIFIGKTTLKIYALNHPIKKAQALVQPHSLFAKLENKYNSWVLFFISMLVIGFFSYMDGWGKDSISTTIWASMALGLVMVLWSAGWALVGRMNKHKAYFSEQIGVISIYTILSMLAYSWQEYFSFIFHGNTLSIIINSILLVICFWGLLYGSLSFATNMHRKKNFRSSGMIASGIIITVLAIGFIDGKSFSPAPNYPSTLKPYFASLGRYNDIKSYMVDNNKIFEDSDLKITKSTSK